MNRRLLFLAVMALLFSAFPVSGTTVSQEATSAQYSCGVCGYIYDPAVGDPDNDIEKGTPFLVLPDDWVCPICGNAVEDFEEYQD